jgi:hypothetical protein
MHSLRGEPAKFTSNWIAESEQCDAKMVFSSRVLIEHFIIQPVYSSILSQMYSKVSPIMGIDGGKEYDQAKSYVGSSMLILFLSL